jgi:hypothetical protein
MAAFGAMLEHAVSLDSAAHSLRNLMSLFVAAD